MSVAAEKKAPSERPLATSAHSRYRGCPALLPCAVRDVAQPWRIEQQRSLAGDPRLLEQCADSACLAIEFLVCEMLFFPLAIGQEVVGLPLALMTCAPS
jgi:hypothetical protein